MWLVRKKAGLNEGTGLYSVVPEYYPRQAPSLLLSFQCSGALTKTEYLLPAIVKSHILDFHHSNEGSRAATKSRKITVDVQRILTRASRPPLHPEITAIEQVGLPEFPPYIIGIKRKNHGFIHYRIAVGTEFRVYIE